MNKIQKVYKIRNSDGLFSPGGQNKFVGYNTPGIKEYSFIKFNKVGKTWNSIGHVKAHIRNLNIVGSDWEIIEYEIVEKQTFKAVEFKNKKAVTTDELIIKDIIE